MHGAPEASGVEPAWMRETRAPDAANEARVRAPAVDDAPVVRVARWLGGTDPEGRTLPRRDRSALRRTGPDESARALGSLLPLLALCRIEPADDDELRRWAVIVHAVAVLAGPSGEMAHSDAPGHALGRRLRRAGYPDARFCHLLARRGPSLTGEVRRLARFASAARAVPADLGPLAELVLHEGRDRSRAEAARLRLARDYYSVRGRARRPAPPGPEAASC